jgi:putative transposase
MAQVARNLTDPIDGFLRNATLLICDRGTKYTAAFKKTLENAGTKTALTPYRAPDCNAYAERFVLSIKSECLSKMIFFGESSPRRAINEYAAHYNLDRPHQGIGNATIQESEQGTGEVECNERLGGLLKSYRRAAQTNSIRIPVQTPGRRCARDVSPRTYLAGRSPRPCPC